MKKFLQNVNNKNRGYLQYLKKWNTSLAKDIAKKESIKMTNIHWEIIFFMRKFYDSFNQTPSMRMLSTLMSQKNKKTYSSIFFYKLFPKEPIKQASKIAGLPLTFSCY